MNKIGRFIISQLISHLPGIIGSLFTVTSITSWYATLTKPEWNPPNWVFGPVWLTLYTLMGISLYIVWQKGRFNGLARIIFIAQLLLNALWSILFFGFENPLVALLEIFILQICIVITILSFKPISKIASLLLLPYLAWVIFASYLNYTILILN